MEDDFCSMKEKIPLSKKDFLIEKFFLGLRTDQGIKQIGEYQDVLVTDWQDKIQCYEKQGLLVEKNGALILTDQGMNVYNSVVTELLKEI